ncbi:hypothetical protein [Kibdelosporangium persicum]|uniref:hypothetical protein n=1 Tax=Kibdelosporangium persicum TaxID=2698649 RepID=UPI001563A831|nr:hypothetical protein [Kibdelosporangium persicum]
MANIPEPVPVTELIAKRRRGRHYAGDGCLNYAEVADAWPVVWNIEEVVRANGVRTRQEHATGTYGTNSWTVYDADDVQRVADAIADGSAVLQPHWCRNTEEGREAQRERSEHWRRQVVRVRWVQSVIVLGLLLCVGVVWFLVARA